MKKILGLIFNPWVLLVLGLLALSLVIWIVGPLVAIGDYRPLDGVTARLVFIGLIVLLIVLRNLLKLWSSRKKNDKVVNQLLAPAAVSDPADGEIKTLNERFTKALETLKTAKFEQPKAGLAGLWSGLSSRVGKRYLYELPWYVIIGAPGSGKTTALVNSGLNFPLA
ncbi:MAG TPA: type VI secretion system membrane subunit TssM, partial [Rhizobacter sp.]|nr:type VI secretion system membrane subunit TssM [Rhizobacter sp.]